MWIAIAVANEISQERDTPTTPRAAYHRIPFPQIPDDEQHPFTDFVGRILEDKDTDPSAETSDHEAQIDGWSMPSTG